MNGFNLSQTQIAMTEQVCPGSARNTISLKLHLPDHTPQKVKEAADIVLDSADIFAASFNRRDGEWFLIGGGAVAVSPPPPLTAGMGSGSFLWTGEKFLNALLKKNGLRTWRKNIWKSWTDSLLIWNSVCIGRKSFLFQEEGFFCMCVSIM